MPGAGTDKTRNWIETPGPVIILVEPQLGENIGAVARVMANFGLGRLRLVKPRDGWPNERALRAAGCESVERVDLCTSCEAELLFSHRRDRGVTGRQGIVAALR